MSSHGSPALELRGISKSFHGHTVLEDVSLSVEPGTAVALIGPSGGGKSTLLRCVNYLETPCRGQVHIGGQAVATDPQHPTKQELLSLRRRVGMVFQSFNLFPHMTVLKNIALPQELTLGRGREESEERGMQLLRRVGLQDKARARPASCSGGQQQRIAIARALAMDPEILLFDEPTSSLDPEVSVEVLDVMKELAESGTTMVVVTHEMGFAKNVAHRAAFLQGGRIVEHGPSLELFANPTHQRTQRFLSAVMDR